jgi:hypothetical protein
MLLVCGQDVAMLARPLLQSQWRARTTKAISLPQGSLSDRVWLTQLYGETWNSHQGSAISY